MSKIKLPLKIRFRRQRKKVHQSNTNWEGAHILSNDSYLSYYEATKNKAQPKAKIEVGLPNNLILIFGHNLLMLLNKYQL